MGLVLRLKKGSKLTFEEVDENFKYLEGLANNQKINDATTVTKGVLKLSGDLSGTADNPTVPGLNAKVDKKEGWDLSEENFSPELKEKLENLEQTAQIQIIKVSTNDLQTLDQAGVMQWLDSQTDLQIDFSKITCIKVIDGDIDRVFTDEFTDEFN